jgi:hypothetical protein
VRTVRRHLDAAVILAHNAKVLQDEASRPVSYRGPQMTWHRKPNPAGGPCAVCGCLGLRLGVDHRALAAGESVHGRYVKRSRHYRGDFAEMYLDAEGKGA